MKLLKYFRKKTEPITFSPLMPRKPNQNFVGLTFKKYLKKQKVNKLISFLDKVNPSSPAFTEFNNKLNFLIDTVEDLSKFKKEINDLWVLCYVLIEESSGIESLQSLFIFPLVSITGEAKFNNDELEKLDSTLDSKIKFKLESIFKSNIDFANKVNELNSWYNYHIKYLKYWGLGISHGDIGFLKEIATNYPNDFEALKSLSPITFINFIKTIKFIYKNNKKGYRAQYRDFYLEKCLEQIIVSKNSGIYTNYRKSLEDYYSEKLIDKSKVNWLFKNLVGYGEKPWNLVWFFFSLNILFSLLFTFGNFNFHFSNDKMETFEKFIAFISFNNTTMLTVGYGDIYPEGIGARILVFSLQIVGFVITSTAIALFLRRVLRF